MTIEQLKARIAELGAEIKAKQADREQLRQALAERIAEHKVGDRVMYNGAEFEITVVNPHWTDERVVYIGAPIRKDGKPAIQAREMWNGPLTKVQK